jgi:hypothetical protein
MKFALTDRLVAAKMRHEENLVVLLPLARTIRRKTSCIGISPELKKWEQRTR